MAGRGDLLERAGVRLWWWGAHFAERFPRASSRIVTAFKAALVVAVLLLLVQALAGVAWLLGKLGEPSQDSQDTLDLIFGGNGRNAGPFQDYP